MAQSPERYTSVAVTLHWVIALLILGQIAGGFYMHNLPNSAPAKFDLYQLHKSFGFSILALTAIRLGWRLTHHPPALPAAMPSWQKFAARTTHWLFYALLFLTPLAGWAMVSVSPLEVPTRWFGLFEISHLPFFNGVSDRAAAEEAFIGVHEFLAKSILFLFVLHVGAALKHGLIDKDGVLRSMSPRFGALIGAGAILAVLFIAAASYGMRGGNDGAVTPVGHTHSHGHDHDDGHHDDQGAEEQTETEIVTTTERDNYEAPEKVIDINVADEESLTGADADTALLWIVDTETSVLKFIGKEGARSFEGRFSQFDATIAFDPENLEASSVLVIVAAGSGATGEEMRDVTMTGREWFDVKDFPLAEFRSTSFRQISGDAYEADGTLTIKDFSKDITLAFTLQFEGEDQARAVGGVDLVRTDFGLGEAASWLEDEKIALEVRVEFEINATR